MAEEIIAALIGAVAALLVTVVAPIINGLIERHQARRVRREEIMGKLRGLSNGLPNLMALQNSATLHRRREQALLRLGIGDTEWRRSNIRYWREVADQAVRDAAHMEKELEEVLGQVRGVFPITDKLSALFEAAEKPRQIMSTRTFSDAKDEQEVEAEFDEAIKEVKDSLRANLKNPLMALVKELEREL